MGRLGFTLVVLGGGLWAVPAADPPADRKADRAKVREQFYGVWLEEAKTEGGKHSTEPFGLCGLEFEEEKWSAWDPPIGPGGG
ncbi:MAG TPA: hypothetical protein VM597_07590, partial [Gemmataceae bacterium]|nr:hypothetical protein [Gemmataceae bacterium]